MRFCPSHDDPIRLTFNDMEEEIGISLLRGAFTPVPLDLGHGAVKHEIVFLNVFQIIKKPLVVLGTFSLIYLIGYAREGVQRIPANAALEAGASFLAEQTQCLDLTDEILRAGVNRAEKIDLVPIKGRTRQHQLGCRGILSKPVSHLAS